MQLVSAAPFVDFLHANRRRAEDMAFAAVWNGCWLPEDFVTVLVDGRDPLSRVAVRDWRVPFERNVGCCAVHSVEALRMLSAFGLGDGRSVRVSEYVAVLRVERPLVLVVAGGRRAALFVTRMPLPEDLSELPFAIGAPEDGEYAEAA
jgi:hypothetical protein